MTARPTHLLVVLPVGFAGKDPLVTFVSVLDPVVVLHTCPFWRPTILTLSFVGEMPIVAIGDPDTIGAWLTTTIVSPLFVDR